MKIQIDCMAGFYTLPWGMGVVGENPLRGFTATYKMWPYGYGGM